MTLKDAVEGGLGDVDEAPGKVAASGEVHTWKAEFTGAVVQGVGASPGLAIGPLHRFRASPVVTDRIGAGAGDPVRERQSLLGAIERATLELNDLYLSMAMRVGEHDAAIFRAQQALLADPELLQDVTVFIEAGRSAAGAWQQVIDRRVVEVRNAADPRIAARAADLHDIGQRVLRRLVSSEWTETPEIAWPDQPCILMAHDLAPSDTARLDPRKVLGLVTAAGGPTSHTAILARALGIPAVVGAGNAVLEVAESTLCILDGTSGRLYSAPTAADLDSARIFQSQQRTRSDEDRAQRYRPALMTDGHRIEVLANIGSIAEAAAAVEAGAEGVGLLRTEFLFLGRDSAPTEEEQFEAYSEMTRALHGLPLIIRTLDIGGDKVLPYLPQPKEDNPFLGVRGLRLCLRQPELFAPQLRAIYRASREGTVKILLPMVATLEELRAAKEIAERVRADLNVPPVEIGIMVEVPSTALLAAEFARECDFFSVGTNDLTQYALAMDRLHPTLSTQADALHPAVLRLIDQTIRGARSAGKWVGVCGGLAGDPLGATILSGLGVTELSMTLPSLAEVKARLRNTSLVFAQSLARRALACATAAEVCSLAG